MVKNLLIEAGLPFETQMHTWKIFKRLKVDNEIIIAAGFKIWNEMDY